MKKFCIIILLAFITVLSVDAQAPIGYGRRQLNAGVGFSGWGIPVYVGMDFGVQHDITVGFEGSFRSYNENYYGRRYGSSIVGLSGNANLHFNRLLEIQNRWDVYAGLNLGFYFWSSPTDYPGNGSSGVGIGAQLGVRYYFRNNLGFNLEIGGGNVFSGGKFGISYLF